MSIINKDSNTLVSGTSGNDNIGNYGGSNVTIDGGAGKDTITNEEGKYVTINGGRGNDKVLNKDSYVMINGNAGDDYLWSDENNPEYVTLDGGTGNDYLTASGDHILFIGGEDDDSILSGVGEYSTIFAGDGDDTIRNTATHSMIYGGAGNDFFHGSQGDYATIVCGEGNDTIRVYEDYGSQVTIHRLIYDGEGNDFFFLREVNCKNYSTIVCGEGDDTIHFDRCRYGNFVIQYTEGAGNDVVTVDLYDGMPNINLNILNGSYTVTTDSSKFSNYNKDLLVIVGNGSIRFIGMAGKSININGTPINGVPSTPTTQTTTPPNTQTTTTPTSTTTPTVTSGSGGGDTIINYYYGDYYDNSNNNGTIIINSSVEGGVTNNTSIDNSKNIVISGNTWTYNGGDKVINNYVEGQVVQLASDYTGIDVQGNSFLVKSSSGAVEIQNSRDKFIGYSATNTDVVAYSYLASGGGNIDGRDKSKAEIMIGGDNSNNQIYAGSGGSSMWGGNGGTDTLTGGEGYDEFFFAMGSGNDVIKNAGDNDVINLLGVSLSQISGFSYDSSSVDLNFNDGGNLKIESTSSVGYRVENQTYTFSHATGQWSTK